MSESAREIEYATKADVDVLRAEMNTGFAELRGETQTEIAGQRPEIGAVEARLTWWLLGGVAALLALFLTLYRLLAFVPTG